MFDPILAGIERLIKPKELNPKNIRKILIVDLNFMGDMLMSSPVPREIKRRCPKAQIDILAYDFCKPVLLGNKFIDNIYTVRKSAWWEAIKARFRDYDLVLQLNTSLKTNALLVLAGKTRLGYNYKHRGCVCNLRVPIQYRTVRKGNRIKENLHLLSRAFGWKFRNYNMEFEIR